MAMQFGVKGMLTEIGKVGFSMVTGGGIVLASLLAWTGAEDLEAIKESVQNYMFEAEGHVSALAYDYQMTVDEANAEISDYRDALAQANNNISELIAAYEIKVAELEQTQTEMANMLTQAEANEIIAKANEEIQSANDAVADAKVYIEDALLANSMVDEVVADAQQIKDQLSVGNDKTVTNISGVLAE